MRLGVNCRFLAAPATGVQRFSLEVVRRLVSRPEVTLLLPRGVQLPADLPTTPRVSRGVLAGPLWEQLELPARVRSEGLSVVLHPANAAPLVGGPHVVVLHDLMPLLRPRDYRLVYRAWARLAHLEAARRAAAVVTVSDWSAEEIVRLSGIPRGRISVVLQAPGPLDYPAAPAAVADLRRRHRIDGPYFVAVVGTDPRKGESFLRRVWFARPDEERPTLLLVGGRAGAVHRTGRLDPDAPSIRRLGAVAGEELRALYTGAVALLHPSEAESFGRPPLEALACGTRVIVAPYGPARAVLGSEAEVVELDSARWGTAVTTLLAESPARRSERIVRGRAWAARYDWDRAVDRLWSVCMAARATTAA